MPRSFFRSGDRGHPSNACVLFRRSGEGGELLQDAVDLGRRVVVAEADPHRAASLLQAEALHQLERVVVAVPHVDPAPGEDLRGLEGMLLSHAHGERRGAFVHARRVGDPEA